MDSKTTTIFTLLILLALLFAVLLLAVVFAGIGYFLLLVAMIRVISTTPPLRDRVRSLFHLSHVPTPHESWKAYLRKEMPLNLIFIAFAVFGIVFANVRLIGFV